MGEMTLDALAKLVQKGFADSDKKTDKKIEDLAALTAEGFVEVNGKILESEERTKGIIKSEVRSLENTVNSNHGAMVSEFIKIHGRADILESKVDKIDQRTIKDDNIIFTDIHNIKKDMTVYESYFKKLGVNIPSKKGAR